MAIINARLFAYFKECALLKIQSRNPLTSNLWHYVGALYDREKNISSLWVNGTRVKHKTFAASWTLFTGYSAVRMGAISLNNWSIFKGRIKAMQVYNVSSTNQQIEAVKYSSGRGKNISCKYSVYTVTF